MSSGDGGTRGLHDTACRTEVPPRLRQLWATFHDIINFHFKAPVSQDLPLLTAKCISAAELGREERCSTPPSTVEVPWACPSLGSPGSQAVSGTKTMTVCTQDPSTPGRSLAQSWLLTPPELSFALRASRAQGGPDYSICI